MAEEWKEVLDDNPGEPIVEETFDEMVEIVEEGTGNKVDVRNINGDDGDDAPGSWQKRIDKLTYQRREAERREAASSEALAAMQTRLAKLEQGDHQQTADKFKSEYSKTRAELAVAIEDGDTEKQIELNEKIADMRFAARAAQHVSNRKPQETSVDGAQQAFVRQQQQTPAQALAWYEDNKTWFNAEGYEQQTEYARSVDVQLDIRGFDKDSPEYYKELNIELKKVFPKLPIRAINDGMQQETATFNTQRNRSPVAPAGGGGTNRSSRRSQFQLTPTEASMAKSLGLTSKDELTEYKRQIELGKTNG
jgi:hypothetical protein